MKSGNAVLIEMEEQKKYFPLIKEKHCKVNPNLAGFMSEWILTTETEKRIQTRLLQMALVLFEIIGVGDEMDLDFAKVSKESISAAKKMEKAFDINDVKGIDPDLYWAIVEAETYVKALNDSFNEYHGDQIDTNVIWQKLEVFLKAYWIEKQKIKG